MYISIIIICPQIFMKLCSFQGKPIDTPLQEEYLNSIRDIYSADLVAYNDILQIIQKWMAHDRLVAGLFLILLHLSRIQVYQLHECNCRDRNCLLLVEDNTIALKRPECSAP